MSEKYWNQIYLDPRVQTPPTIPDDDLRYTGLTGTKSVHIDCMMYSLSDCEYKNEQVISKHHKRYANFHCNEPSFSSQKPR